MTRSALAAGEHVPPPSAAEWARLTRARFRVRQEYQYAYPTPATNLRQRLIMLPPDRYGDQRLVAHEFTARGAEGAALRWEWDQFGNRVHHVTAPVVPKAVAFAVDYTVERTAADAPPRLPAGAPIGTYLAPTALTAPCDRIRLAAREIAEAVAAEVVAADDGHPLGDPETRLGKEARRQRVAARLAGEWAARAITYQYGVTGVQTPAAMALHLGRGVCQDYAHLALALLRQLRVAARYVSGHVLGEGAPHAWIEALLADADAPGEVRAVPYDPTHRRAPGLDYITVAVGRDYADIAPTSGTFSGVTGRFTASKDAWIEEVA